MNSKFRLSGNPFNNNIDFISSIPKSNPYESVGDHPFLKQSQGSVSNRIFSQIIMIFLQKKIETLKSKCPIILI